jgi:hypothetical protein
MKPNISRVFLQVLGFAIALPNLRFFRIKLITYYLIKLDRSHPDIERVKLGDNRNHRHRSRVADWDGI